MIDYKDLVKRLNMYYIEQEGHVMYTFVVTCQNYGKTCQNGERKKWIGYDTAWNTIVVYCRRGEIINEIEIVYARVETKLTL